jgi:hypothetical protein
MEGAPKIPRSEFSYINQIGLLPLGKINSSAQFHHLKYGSASELVDIPSTMQASKQCAVSMQRERVHLMTIYQKCDLPPPKYRIVYGHSTTPCHLHASFTPKLRGRYRAIALYGMYTRERIKAAALGNAAADTAKALVRVETVFCAP